MAQYEFLPLCDVLFNIISLAAYFCDIVFDVVMGYALYVDKQIDWFIVTLLLVLLSSTIQQVISFRWYLHTVRDQGINSDEEKTCIVKDFKICSILMLHVFQCGVLWRYFKLFIPVDLRCVKYEVRDLCMLRLIHAFCESMPLLLIQLYFFWRSSSEKFADLNTISIMLSLFSVCWALASFSKNVRRHNVHRLVLTWLGVIFQFFWRLGTVGARALTLVAYATIFEGWVFLVIMLHWISMLLWLLSPKNVFHGERLSLSRKAVFYAVIAFVYTFAYINLLETNHKEKMLMFYVIMGLENAMLMFVWVIGISSDNLQMLSYSYLLPLAVLLLFSGGIGFMTLYYRYFHVRRLKYEAGGRYSTCNTNNNNNNTCNNNKNIDDLSKTSTCDIENINHNDKEIIRRHSFSGGYTNLSDLSQYTKIQNENSLSGEEGIAHKYNVGGIPGVFNCRFSNAYMAAIQKRKRKKPTSFIPPPSINHENEGENHPEASEAISYNVENSGYNSVPFWCRPLPTNSQQNCCSENECSSVGSRPDIQQKLQEKKQKQMAELRIIEEEIKQGKLLQRPDDTPTPEPPPQDKKPPHYNSPEILLMPSCLGSSSITTNYYDWPLMDGNPVCGFGEEESNDQMLTLMYKSYRCSSEQDMQLSLPRSYTLPREFKYYRKPRSRKQPRMEHTLPSTNSSDGDVDSGDESDSESSNTTSHRPPVIFPVHPIFKAKHETKL